MAYTPFTILTTKNVPIDLTSTELLKFTKGIKIGDNTLVDVNGNIPFERISSSEGFTTVVGRITSIEQAIGSEEGSGILKRIKSLETLTGEHTGTLADYNARITANANSISTINETLNDHGISITAIKAAIGEDTNPAEGTILKRLAAIEEAIGGTSTGDSVLERLTKAEKGISDNSAAIEELKGKDTAHEGRLDALEAKDLAHEGRLDAVEAKASTNEGAISTINETIGSDDVAGSIKGRIKKVEDVVPTAASASNQLADKDFVNSSIQTATAYFDGNWATFAEVPSDEAGFTAKNLPVPGPNNYLVVLADEDHSGQTWRYKYTGAAGVAYSKSLWVAEYKVNDTALTDAQAKALNSGVTAELVGKITTNEGAISTINETIGSDDTKGLRKRIADLESELNATDGVKARLTAVEAKASTNEGAISTINTTIGADDSSGLRKRIADVESGVNTLNGQVAAINDVIPHAATKDNELADKKFVNDADAALAAQIAALSVLNLPATFKSGNRRYQLVIDENDNLVMTRLDDVVA